MDETLRSLQRAPFHLDDAALDWVESTRQRLAGTRRLAQLFNVMLNPADDALLGTLARLTPGAITQFTLGGLELALAAAARLQAAADVPVLVSSDVEGGSIGFDGMSPMPNPLGMAAVADPEIYRRALDVLALETKAVGINWTFTPVIDINADFRSAIVGTRSFGSDPTRIKSLALEHIKVMQFGGIAATAKHWPGEGFDARDQHLVTTVNPLDLAEWQRTFGDLYKTLIDAGVMSIMVGHIAFPAYARSVGAEGLEPFRPASVSRELNLGLLRGELGFNGLITSDATLMAGLGSWAPRARFLPEVIENGCDMILFTPDFEGDLKLLEKAIEGGRLSERRVDEALTRVLGMKAALGLHKLQLDAGRLAGARQQLQRPTAMKVAREAASASITLVKDIQTTLPLHPSCHARIVIVTLDESLDDFGPFRQHPLRLAELLAARGFVPRAYDRCSPPTRADTDLVLYVLTQESLLTRSTIFLDWRRLHGTMEQAMRRTWHEIPTVLISMGQPYYLYDAPRMPCVINAYAPGETVQEALVAKLVGDEPFVGVSPVDPFCGQADARY